MSRFPKIESTIEGKGWAATSNYNVRSYHISDRREDLGVVVLQVADSTIALEQGDWLSIAADLFTIIDQGADADA